MSRNLQNSAIKDLPVLDVVIMFNDKVYHWARTKSPWKQGLDYRFNHIDCHLKQLEGLESGNA